MPIASPAPQAPHTRRAWQAWLGGFNLLPYRERQARDARRRQVRLYGAAIACGALGAGAWVAGSAWVRADVEVQRTALEARHRLLRPQIDEAERTLRILDAGHRRRQQASRLAVSYHPATELLMLLGRVRGEGVRFDALRITRDGAVLDARAVDHPAAARWLARIARERPAWAFDVDTLKSTSAAGELKPAAATVEPSDIVRMPLRFTVQVRWEKSTREAARRHAASEERI